MTSELAPVTPDKAERREDSFKTAKADVLSPESKYNLRMTNIRTSILYNGSPFKERTPRSKRRKPATRRSKKQSQSEPTTPELEVKTDDLGLVNNSLDDKRPSSLSKQPTFIKSPAKQMPPPPMPLARPMPKMTSTPMMMNSFVLSNRQKFMNTSSRYMTNSKPTKLTQTAYKSTAELERDFFKTLRATTKRR